MSTITKTSQSMTQQATRPTMQIILAWGVMFAVMLPAIIWGVIMGNRAIWWTATTIPTGILTLCALTLTLTPLFRALRGYLLAFIAILVGCATVALITHQPAYIEWVKKLPLAAQVLLSPGSAVALRMILLLLVVLTLFGSDLNRRDLFLVRGDMNAPVQQDFIFRIPMPWWAQALLFLVIFSGGTGIFMALNTHFSSTIFAQVLHNLPFILLAAAINGFVEEFIFRSVLLTRLIPVLGQRQSNWLQATFFGLGHYFGNPSGPLGVLMAGAMGWVLGKSVLETRGFTIAWVLHFAQDAIIFSFLVISLA